MLSASATARERTGESAPEIGADDAGRGILVCHVDGPDAGAGANVEDLLGFAERRAVQLAVHQAEDDLMVQVQPVLLHLEYARLRNGKNENKIKKQQQLENKQKKQLKETKKRKTAADSRSNKWTANTHLVIRQQVLVLAIVDVVAAPVLKDVIVD